MSQLEKIRRLFGQVMPTVLSVFLVLMILLSLTDISFLRDAAQTTYYTENARNISRRIVNEELGGMRDDSSIANLTVLLRELKRGGSTYSFTPLRDAEYQGYLTALIQCWGTLQDEIEALRVDGPGHSSILEVSEKFDVLAEQAANRANAYTGILFKELVRLEQITASCGIVLILVLLFNILQNRRLSTANSELSHTAYLDKHTGLPNKSRCEELLHAPGELDLSTACVMFDLNNLKKVNDAMGHQAGDDMIRGFAKLLRRAAPASGFVGRYGGDEFVAILTDVTPGEVDAFLKRLESMAWDYNRSGTQFMPVVPLSYAAGFAHSAQYPESTMESLFKAADDNMYHNKIAMKAARRAQDLGIPH